MDDDDVEDLFDEVDLLPPSSQGSLINAATNLNIHHEDDGQDPDDAFKSPRCGQRINCDDPEDNISIRTRVHTEQDQAYPNAEAIDKIEAIFEQMADVLLNDKHEMSVTLKTRRPDSRRMQQPDHSQDCPTRKLCFPGKTANEAWRFTVVVRILELVHEALRKNVVISKRDMYYRDPALFGRQAHVDRYVDDIAYTLGLPRCGLNVVAAAKGLVAGVPRLYRRDGTALDMSSDREGILVPKPKDVLYVDMTAVKWILAIEKEATFRSIAASSFWDKITTEGVIITGKGYPDLSTRCLLHFLATPSPRNGFASPPVYGLADFDPDGIAILATYKHGSKALAHESANHVVPNLRWLGLRSEHLHLAQGDTHATQGLLTLSARDRKKAKKILEDVTSASEELSVQKGELQTMLMLNTKAELQLLDAVPDGMLDLLSSKLCEH